MKTFALALLAAALPSFALAHGGHPDVAGQHDAVHALWIALPLALAAVGATLAWRRHRSS